MHIKLLLGGIALSCLSLAAAADRPLEFVLAGELENRQIDEASGLQAGNGGVLFVHNDEKRDVFVIDHTGRHLGSFKLDGAKSHDREDITRVPGTQGPLLVMGDIGDNKGRRRDVELHFFAEPLPGNYETDQEIRHTVSVRYPEGARDVEAMAFDPVSGMILLMSKRDAPPHLYGVPLDRALAERRLEATFLGVVPGFRPPTAEDLLKYRSRGLYVSQPTGMDISRDGSKAAVITYRSLYLFERENGESWAEAFQRQPVELVGPPGAHQEAVAFSADGRSVYVTTERRPAPLHRVDLQPGN
jgi:hypothetical protein